VKLDRLLVDQIKNDELIVANLYDGGDGFVRIFRDLRIGIVHFKKSSCDAVRAIGGTVFNIHQHNINIDHNTQLDLDSTPLLRTNALASSARPDF
jgi:hypothetical protein